ncbi:MAG: DinB family protein [Chloroflexi bacterium]|nr:DinB family protein [Chloroflexota bacterium]
MTQRAWSDRLAGWIAWNHEEMERSIRAVAPEAIHVRPSRTAPSIGFHAWHMGRWVDRNNVALASWLDPERPESEIWIARDVAARWGLAGVRLGDFGGTGAGLDDDESAALPLPPVGDLLEYVLATYRAFEATLARLDDDAILDRTVVDLYGDENQISEVLLNHLSHADRHLGMIEAIRGVLGERGTATI